VKDHVTVMNGIHRCALRRSLLAIVWLASTLAASQSTLRAEDASGAIMQAAMLRKSAEHFRHGLQLAERRAVFAAHDQFIEALKMVAYQLDADAGLSTHSQALAAGLSALDEADSFLARRTEVLTPAELSAVMAAHRTKIGDEGSQPGGDITPLQAVERYLAVAREKLSTASGGAPIASSALYGLGRVYALRATQEPARAVGFEQKAIALYRTALGVDANNHLAGNELGVLLYRNGLHEEALWTLLRSVSVSPEPETAHNLFIVYQALGDAEGAAWAEVLHQTLVASQAGSPLVEANVGGGSALSVRWVDTDTFSNVAGAGDLVQPAETPAPVTQQPPPKALAGSTAKAGADKLLWPNAEEN
jgi:tetratricopeptide (TPR) repeat protein